MIVEFVLFFAVYEHTQDKIILNFFSYLGFTREEFKKKSLKKIWFCLFQSSRKNK